MIPMRKFMQCCAGYFMACAVFFCCVIPVKAEEDTPALYARSAVLMDGDSGRILYEKEAHAAMPMASTTKIMTCIVSLEEAEPDQVCTVSGNAAAQPQVKLGMQKGDTFYLKDLLYSLMLESHNDTAVCIAENVCGSVEGFAAKMNEKARAIGCEDTYYITPNGLDAEDANGIHHTTARDLALVMRYCLKQSEKAEEFLTITGTTSYTFTNRKGDRSYGCTNHNALLSILTGAVSGKTGFTGNAGYCYVGAVEQDGKSLIVALLACGWPNHKGYKWVDTKKLVQYGLSNFEKRTIVQRNLSTDAVLVQDGVQPFVRTEVCFDRAPAEGTGDMAAEWRQEEQETLSDLTVLARMDEQVETRIDLAGALAAPVQKGQQVGTVQFLLAGELYAEYPVAAVESVGVRDYRYCFMEILNLFLPGER